MRKIDIKWKKGDSIVTQGALECDCGGIAIQVAYFGGVHSDFSSYLFQCPKCKNITQTNYMPAHSDEDFEGHGYAKVKINIPPTSIMKEENILTVEKLHKAFKSIEENGKYENSDLKSLHNLHRDIFVYAPYCSSCMTKVIHPFL